MEMVKEEGQGGLNLETAERSLDPGDPREFMRALMGQSG